MEKELKEKVFELVGEASMCWDDTGSAEFDATKASQVGEKLLALVDDARAREKGLWQLSLVHLNKEQREGVVATYERIKEHQATLEGKDGAKPRKVL